jgi:luciferase-like monooxygenase
VSYLKEIEAEVSAWPNVSMHAHRFGGKEFRFGKAEIGHLHANGTLDIPFPRALRDALIERHEAEGHRWVPDSGWTTFRIRSGSDVRHAVELMRISYLRYALKTASDPGDVLKRESEALRLNPQFAALLEKFVPALAG